MFKHAKHLSSQRLRTIRTRFHPVRERLRRDPLARLADLEEVRIAAELGIGIDVNQATVDDWLRLPGISIHQARTLTTLSQRGITFYCVEDIAAVLNTSVERLAPLMPILQFRYYDSSSEIAPSTVPLNQATVTQLMAVPLITPALAERIVNERRVLLFKHWQDVQHRLRLTPQQVELWIHYLKV